MSTQLFPRCVAFIAALFVVVFGGVASLQIQEKGGEDETGPYDAVSGWPQPWAQAGYIWGSQPGVFAESPNRIFLAVRGELKLPPTTGRGFNGIWGSLGERATVPKADMRNCLLVVDGSGKVNGYVKDRSGQTVMTRMSPELLTQVATQVGGTFVDGTGQPDMGLREVESRIASLEKRDFESRTETEWADRAILPLGLALLALFAALLIPERGAP